MSARRRLELELSPPALSALDGVTATVEWDAGSGTAALSLTLELETGADICGDDSERIGDGGEEGRATILLANDAVNLFTADGLELTLTLAASNGGGTVFLTATFESSSRPFCGGVGGVDAAAFGGDSGSGDFRGRRKWVLRSGTTKTKTRDMS